MDPLTPAECAMLDLERDWWATQVGKESAIVDRIGVSPVRYYQRLNRLVETEAALAYDPVTVNRLRRLRTKGRADG
ncbi:DUF3263 domain-containing protein [Mycobacterium phage Che9c]|uniref:DUF3263 domain-containing protein n=1 Tax=Mycobacterium phage Che9c TaxID=2907832 RepID=Q854V6_9CAUD|nr:DUF3263 domain-containing protein [Mycobacterium phage Che9c]AAN12602.1 hypothetical protein PBI_CHE9C_42 [Mycobacterium phage Che9c]